MTIQEILAQDKDCKLPEFKEFGRIVELGDKISFCTQVDGEDTFKPLSIKDVLRTDWLVYQEPRTFWLGLCKIQSHSKEYRIMQAIEGAEAPGAPTADHSPWVKVIEVKE